MIKDLARSCVSLRACVLRRDPTPHRIRDGGPGRRQGLHPTPCKTTAKLILHRNTKNFFWSRKSDHFRPHAPMDPRHVSNMRARLLLAHRQQRQTQMKTIQRQLHGGRVMSLDEVSQELGVSIERVRQIEHGAIKKLKRQLKRLGIKPEIILPENYDEVKA